MTDPNLAAGCSVRWDVTEESVGRALDVLAKGAGYLQLELQALPLKRCDGRLRSRHRLGLGWEQRGSICNV